MRRGLCSRAAIIGTVLALLAGCSALKLTYSNGPQLAWWWLDGYLDLDRAQAPRAKAAIAQWFDWHRTTQLAGTAALLGTLAADVVQPQTPAQVCRWLQLGREHVEPSLQQALRQFAPLLPLLGEPQLQALERKYARTNADWKREHLQSDADDRRDAAVKRVTESFESLYGRLDEPQRRAVAAGIAASPFDPAAALVEREARQRDAVQTLRRLLAERADADRAATALRALADRAEHSPDPAYRAQQQRVADYNCAFAAQVHNATTTAQRRTARDRLKGWEDDLRMLAARSDELSR